MYVGKCLNVIFGRGENRRDGHERSVVCAVAAESGSVRHQLRRGKTITKRSEKNNETKKKKTTTTKKKKKKK